MITPRRPVFLNEEQMQYLNPTEDTISWSIVADETAEILIGRSSKHDEKIRQGIISLITEGDIEDIATLWSQSPNTCLAGMMWRSFLIYQWFIQDEKTLLKQFEKGLKAPLENTTKVDYKEITDLINKVMRGELPKTNKTIYDFYADMAAFLRVLAVGVTSDEDRVIFNPSENFADLLTLKAKSILNLAKEFEDASTDINTLNPVSAKGTE